MVRIENQTSQQLINLARRIVLPLNAGLHKGQAGRVAVVGGSEDYTGAPYFSAIASTLVGADMSHVICEKSAGPVIKSYSPNLIVHPYLYESQNKPSNIEMDDIIARVNSVLDRVHVVVVGPGLGRDQLMLDTAAEIINQAKKRKMPIIVDADGLYLVQKNLDLIKGYTECVLTPNVVEFARLIEAAGLGASASASSEKQSNTDENNMAFLLAKALGHVTVLEKGNVDRISNGYKTIINDMPGGLKRVSGQGDTLSGSLATFFAWRRHYLDSPWEKPRLNLGESDLALLAAFGASATTRRASALAFEAKNRATLTSDITNHVGHAFYTLFCM